MKYLIPSVILFTVFTLSEATSSGQNAPGKFGVVSMNEVQMQKYDKDTLADAVVLFDVGKTRFINPDNSFDIEFEKTTRIKIFKKSAFSYAEVEIPYYYEGNTTEAIKSIEAFTYNFENGAIVTNKVKPSNIYDEKVNNYWRVKKFAFPNVKEGSVIEYRYVLVSPFKIKLRDWEFQSRIPTVYSNYTVRMIPFYEYTWLLQGAGKFSYQKSWEDTGIKRQFGPSEFNDMIHEYTMTNVPAFRSEDYITSINDYIIKIHFQLSKIHSPTGGNIDIVKTWPALIKELDTHEDFGKYVKKTEKSASKIIDPALYSNLSPREKFDVIVKYVKGNFNWNQYAGMYANESLNKFLEQKKGNTGNINLMLTGLLSAAGIEAYPVILSTRNNGKIRDIPFLDFFNYCIAGAYINDTLLLADATDTFTPSEVLPVRCLNDQGLLIKRDAVKWTPLAITDPSTLNSTFDLTISRDSDTLNAGLDIEATGYHALERRERYYNDKDLLIKDFSSVGYRLFPDSIKTEGMMETDKPLRLKIPLKMEIDKVGDRILVSPFLREPINKNELTEESRTYPIDFIYPEHYIYLSRIHLSPGCKVVSVPPEIKIDNENFSLIYNTVANDSVITVKGEYIFKKSIYKPSAYSSIRFYFNEIIKDFNNQIVLRFD